jgi:aerobic-type carbon monoxide dehydrogenase small subunit (CoxS/CutS family)
MARRSTAQRSRNPLLVPDKMLVAMIVNGVETQLKVTPWTTFLDVLRDHLDLTGTKKGEAAMSQSKAKGASHLLMN